MNEDWDDMAMAEPLAGEELERLLARYGRVRLDPSQAQLRRARSVVMEAAWRQRIEASQVPARAAERRLPFSGWGVRRVGVSMSAAVIAGLMLGTSVFAGTRAGGPLYETRIAIEELGYPADTDGRVDAQLQAAQVRLAEAVEASGRHDDGATIAALAAFDRTLAELDNTSGPAADRALLAIQLHHGVLEEIAATVSVAAAGGLDRAIANSERLMERLSNADTDPATGAGGGQGNGPGGVANPGYQPGTGVGPGGGPATADPTAVDPTASATPKPAGGKPTEDPEATPRPTKTPRPTDTPEPAATAEPQPTATPNPGGQHPDRTPRPRPSNGGGPDAGERGGRSQEDQP